jgi:hypothetical protein
MEKRLTAQERSRSGVVIVVEMFHQGGYVSARELLCALKVFALITVTAAEVATEKQLNIERLNRCVPRHICNRTGSPTSFARTSR